MAQRSVSNVLENSLVLLIANVFGDFVCYLGYMLKKGSLGSLKMHTFRNKERVKPFLF